MKFLRSISIGGLPDIQQLWSSKLLLLIHASQSNMQESHGHNFLLPVFFFFESKITQSKHFMKKVLCQNYKVNRNSLSAFLHPNYQQELPCTTFAGPYMAIKNPTMSLPVGFLVLIQACRGSDNEIFLL